jgi:lipoate synthase
MRNKKVKVAVYVPPERYAELERKAKRLGLSVATLILEMIANARIANE